MTVTIKRKTATLPVETSEKDHVQSETPESTSAAMDGTANLVRVEAKAGVGTVKLEQALGATARLARKSQRMTLAVLAKAIGSHVGNLSRIERGEQRITMELWNRICSALGEDSMLMWNEAIKSLKLSSEKRANIEAAGQEMFEAVMDLADSKTVLASNQSQVVGALIQMKYSAECVEAAKNGLPFPVRPREVAPEAPTAKDEEELLMHFRSLNATRRRVMANAMENEATAQRETNLQNSMKQEYELLNDPRIKAILEEIDKKRRLLVFNK